MMKTAIVGSHSTWKSTLLDAIETTTPKLKEVAREVIQVFWKSPQEMTHQERVAFQSNVYSNQVLYEKELWEFISDRSIYDNLAYAYHTDKELYKALSAHAKNNHKWYDNVIYIPIEFWLENDWVRFTWDEFQKQVDDTIKMILKEFWVDYKTITWSVDERVQQVNSILWQ